MNLIGNQSTITALPGEHFQKYFLVITAALCAMSLSAKAEQTLCTVDFRDGGGRKEVVMLKESGDGIEIQIGSTKSVTTDATTPQFIRWDQIRSISGDSAEPIRSRRLEIGESLWRGRTRLTRGDLRGARECFLVAAKGIEPSASLLRMMASEGIAQTASVARDEWAQSLEAALKLSVLRGRIGVPKLWIDAIDPIDHDGGLILSVAPVWIDGDSAKSAQGFLVAAADRARSENDLALAQIDSDAARIAAADAGLPQPPEGKSREAQSSSPDSLPLGNLPPATNSAKSAAKNGAKFLALWADAVSSDPAARKKSRTSLAQMIRSEEGMLRVWAMYAEGRSLVMESDPDEVRKGVGKMLMIPAAYGIEMPRLAEAAVAQSAIALARIQDGESAAILRRIQSEYQAQFSEGAEKDNGKEIETQIDKQKGD